MKESRRDRKQEFEQLKQEYFNVDVPEEGRQKMMEGIEKARKEKTEYLAGMGEIPETQPEHEAPENVVLLESRKPVSRLTQIWRRTGAVAAAALAILVITPNVSPAAAEAMGNIPLIGSVIRVVTVRNYQMDDGNHQADVAVPKVETTGPAEADGAGESGKLPEAVEQLNRSAEEYADMLIKQFEADIAQSPEGHQGLDMDYEVVTDTDTWFTLRILVLETQASGYQHAKYYHINKETGQIVRLSDIFKPDADYVTALCENIKQQMRDQMAQDASKTFWPDDLQMEHEDQNFYFNQDGKLVIVFDEYEVAPGYMGMQEFVIPDEVIAGICLVN